MHLVYSAYRNINKPLIPKSDPALGKEAAQRNLGYLAACKKHRQTIAAIQQYLPGWRPKPPSPIGELFTNFDLHSDSYRDCV